MEKRCVNIFLKSNRTNTNLCGGGGVADTNWFTSRVHITIIKSIETRRENVASQLVDDNADNRNRICSCVVSPADLRAMDLGSIQTQKN